MREKIRMNKIIKLLQSNDKEKLYRLLDKQEYFHALKVLEAKGCIKCFYSIDSLIPLNIALTAEAYNFQFSRTESFENRLFDFISGVASGVIMTLLVQFIVNATH